MMPRDRHCRVANYYEVTRKTAETIKRRLLWQPQTPLDTMFAEALHTV